MKDIGYISIARSLSRPLDLLIVDKYHAIEHDPTAFISNVVAADSLLTVFSNVNSAGDKTQCRLFICYPTRPGRWNLEVLKIKFVVRSFKLQGTAEGRWAEY